MTESTPSDVPDLIAYAESAIVEDDAVLAARARAEELGTTPVSPAVGALLALLARTPERRRSRRSGPAPA